MKLHFTQVGIMNFFFMLGMTMVLAVDTTLFSGSNSTVYNFFLKIMPQVGYAVLSFFIVLLLFTGFVFRNDFLEVVGLFSSGVFLLFILSGFLLTFPNIGSVAFAVWTLASFMAIVEVMNRSRDRIERMSKTIKEENDKREFERW